MGARGTRQAAAISIMNRTENVEAEKREALRHCKSLAINNLNVSIWWSLLYAYRNSLCIDYKGDAQMPRIEEGLSPPQPPTQQHATLFDARDSSKWKVFTFIMWPLMCNMHPLACSRRGRRVVAPYFCEGAEAMRIAACKVFCLYLDI